MLSYGPILLTCWSRPKPSQGPFSNTKPSGSINSCLISRYKKIEWAKVPKSEVAEMLHVMECAYWWGWWGLESRKKECLCFILFLICHFGVVMSLHLNLSCRTPHSRQFRCCGWTWLWTPLPLWLLPLSPPLRPCCCASHTAATSPSSPAPWWRIFWAMQCTSSPSSSPSSLWVGS